MRNTSGLQNEKHLRPPELKSFKDFNSGGLVALLAKSSGP
jgi:hypothetical protein